MLAIDAPMTHRPSQEPGAPIGLAIRYARKAAGLSGEKLAEATGLSLRTIVKIEQGDGAVALGRYKTVACELGLEWMFDVFGRDTSDEALGTPKYYLSGMTALCLPPADGRPPALWYTSSLSNPSSWRIAGKHIAHTGALLGVAGLWNATATIAQYGVVAPCIWAANPERAVFDLLIDSCEIRQCRVPNVQVTDVDDVVNLEQVREWVVQCEPFLADAARGCIEDWLNGGHQ